MNKLIAAAIGSVLISLLTDHAQAGTAIWDLNPASGDWNTATNWTPMTVPNGSADSAIFGLSNTTNVSISADTEVNGIFFTPGASAYTITASPNLTLTISGVGITNISGRTQNFVTAVNGADSTAQTPFNQGKTAARTSKSFCFGCEASSGILFANGATAGSSTTFTNQGAVMSDLNGGFTAFDSTSSAGSSTFINNGGAVAGSSGGFTTFSGASTAANATFVNQPGTGGAGSGVTFFDDTSSAGNATLTNNGGAVGQSGSTRFFGMSTADNATIINNEGGLTFFSENSTASSATIIANSGTGGGTGGEISFESNSDGGTSRIEVFGNGSLEVFRHNDPGVTIGSLEGDGNVLLGDSNLTIGSNNLSTKFSGVIGNGSRFFGDDGSLVKVGSGTLILSGANTYRGNTNVRGGVLQVDGSITSNTYVNAGGTLSGTGTISRNLTDASGGTVSPGHALGTLGINGNYRQTSFATLLVNIAGLSTSQFSVLDVNGFATLNGAYEILDPVLLNGFVPTIGQSFTFLNYASLNGTFFMSDANIDNIKAHWEVTYGPTSAILTVAPGNVPIIPIPDQGSTLVLLTLGSLGLVTYQSQRTKGTGAASCR